MGLIVYYSSRSENTHRFLLKLGRRLLRLPLFYNLASVNQRAVISTLLSYFS